MTAMDELTQRVAQEVTELHQFFEDWFRGSIDQSTARFARFTDVTAAEFHLISPAGTMVDRDQAAAWIWDIHGARPTARMWVDKVTVLIQRSTLCLATYEEWQESPAGRTVRFSSVLFEADPDAPNGLRWLHVHETWIELTE